MVGSLNVSLFDLRDSIETAVRDHHQQEARTMDVAWVVPPPWASFPPTL